MGANGIYGLSGSGLDIESLVKVGMMSKQSQYDKMYQTETKNTWLKEAYSNIYSDLTTFKYSTLSNYKLQSNMSAMTASTTDNSVVTATANGAAAAMNHKVAVSNVASNAYLLTGDNQTIDRQNTSTSEVSTNLSDVLFKSYTDIKNADGTHSYEVTWNDGSSDQTKTVNGTDVAISIKLKDSSATDAATYTVEYTYNDLFQSGKTLSDFASAIAKSGANIQGGYDVDNDSFSFYNKTGGEKNIIGINATTDEATRLLNSLHLASYDANAATPAAALTDLPAFTTKAAGDTIDELTKGSNATVNIDGKNYTLDTNKITVAGVTYNFTGKTEAGKTATISVTQDTEKIVDNVKQFVADYNKLLDSLNSKLSETRYSDYKPLTKAQEAEMKEDKVAKWNEKAKSGLLYNDSTIRKLVSAMREAVYTKVDAVDSDYNTMSSIGITSSTTKGHLTLDESKLRKALAEDSDCVYQLFASDQDSSYIAGTTATNKITAAQKADDYRNTGVANRLYSVMTEHMGNISDIAGTSADTNDQSYLGKLITNMQTKMNNFQTLMKSYEKKLYNKYDAMEVALSKLGTQLSYITGGQ